MNTGRSHAKLSVNVNKVATLRNSRGGTLPSVVDATRACIAAGAPGITVHPRADARHITFADVRDIAAELAPLKRRVEQRLAGNGRLLVRYSGTEPLLRVMIEGRDQHEIQGWAAEIVNTVKEHLG